MSAPLSLLAPAGANAQQIAPLLWGLIWLSVIVAVIIAVAVLAGITRRSRGTHDPASIGPEHSRGGLWLIYAGTGISAAVLLGFIGWTLATMASTANPPHPAVFTIDVAAEQWWWKFTYEATGALPGFVTAEISLDDFRVLPHDVRRARGDYFTVVQHDDVFGQV